MTARESFTDGTPGKHQPSQSQSQQQPSISLREGSSTRRSRRPMSAGSSGILSTLARRSTRGRSPGLKLKNRNRSKKCSSHHDYDGDKGEGVVDSNNTNDANPTVVWSSLTSYWELTSPTTASDDDDSNSEAAVAATFTDYVPAGYGQTFKYRPVKRSGESAKPKKSATNKKTSSSISNIDTTPSLPTDEVRSAPQNSEDSWPSWIQRPTAEVEEVQRSIEIEDNGYGQGEGQEGGVNDALARYEVARATFEQALEALPSSISKWRHHGETTDAEAEGGSCTAEKPWRNQGESAAEGGTSTAAEQLDSSREDNGENPENIPNPAEDGASTSSTKNDSPEGGSVMADKLYSTPYKHSSGEKDIVMRQDTLNTPDTVSTSNSDDSSEGGGSFFAANKILYSTPYKQHRSRGENNVSPQNTPETTSTTTTSGTTLSSSQGSSLSIDQDSMNKLACQLQMINTTIGNAISSSIKPQYEYSPKALHDCIKCIDTSSVLAVLQSQVQEAMKQVEKMNPSPAASQTQRTNLAEQPLETPSSPRVVVLGDDIDVSLLGDISSYGGTTEDQEQEQRQHIIAAARRAKERAEHVNLELTAHRHHRHQVDQSTLRGVHDSDGVSSSCADSMTYSLDSKLGAPVSSANDEATVMTMGTQNQSLLSYVTRSADSMVYSLESRSQLGDPVVPTDDAASVMAMGTENQSLLSYVTRSTMVYSGFQEDGDDDNDNDNDNDESNDQEQANAVKEHFNRETKSQEHHQQCALASLDEEQATEEHANMEITAQEHQAREMTRGVSFCETEQQFTSDAESHIARDEEQEELLQLTDASKMGIENANMDLLARALISCKVRPESLINEDDVITELKSWLRSMLDGPFMPLNKEKNFVEDILNSKDFMGDAEIFVDLVLTWNEEV